MKLRRIAVWTLALAVGRDVSAQEPAAPVEGATKSSFLSDVRAAGLFGFKADADAPASAPLDNLVPWRLSVREDVGHGVGYRNGYTCLEGFLPVWQASDRVAFADVRGVNFQNADRWEYNIGGGYRQAIGCSEWVVGFNSFYDGRQNDGRSFSQLGAGLELLSPWLEWRGNGYFVLGPSTKSTSGTFTQLVGVDQFVTTTRRTVTAMDGFDTEVGAPIPALERFYTRAYVGCYYYTGTGVESLTGFRTRLESQLTQQMTAHFAYQNDRVFGNTISAGVTIALGAPAYRSGTGGPTLSNILGQRVVRDINVVLQENSSSSTTYVPGQSIPPTPTLSSPPPSPTPSPSAPPPSPPPPPPPPPPAPAPPPPEEEEPPR